jgi:enoyl-CoA hydratase
VPEFSFVDLSTGGGVARLTVRSPANRNALTPSLAREFIARLDQIVQDPSVGVVVLAADGPTFCAGADRQWIADMAARPDSSETSDGLSEVYAMFERLSTLGVPSIAAVGGAVVGAGINLAAACDVRVVGQDFIARGFGRAGLHPGGGHLELLTRTMSLQDAASLLFFGAELGADEAVRSGFALAVVPREDLLAHCEELASAAAADVELTRRVATTWRALNSFRTSAATSSLLERSGQLWSLARFGAVPA